MPVKGKSDKPPRVVVVRKITEYEAKLLFSVYKKHAEIVEQIDSGKTWKRADVVGGRSGCYSMVDAKCKFNQYNY
jgi:hypothetical protein